MNVVIFKSSRPTFLMAAPGHVVGMPCVIGEEDEDSGGRGPRHCPSY